MRTLPRAFALPRAEPSPRARALPRSPPLSTSSDAPVAASMRSKSRSNSSPSRLASILADAQTYRDIRGSPVRRLRRDVRLGVLHAEHLLRPTRGQIRQPIGTRLHRFADNDRLGKESSFPPRKLEINPSCVSRESGSITMPSFDPQRSPRPAIGPRSDPDRAYGAAKC